MSLSVIKQNGRVLVAHAEQRHGAMDVGVVAPHDVTSRHINDVLTLVSQQASDRIALQPQGGPASKENTVLRNVSVQITRSALGRSRRARSYTNLDLSRSVLLFASASLLENESRGNHGPL